MTTPARSTIGAFMYYCAKEDVPFSPIGPLLDSEQDCRGSPSCVWPGFEHRCSDLDRRGPVPLWLRGVLPCAQLVLCSGSQVVNSPIRHTSEQPRETTAATQRPRRILWQFLYWSPRTLSRGLWPRQASTTTGVSISCSVGSRGAFLVGSVVFSAGQRSFTPRVKESCPLYGQRATGFLLLATSRWC